MNIVMWIVAGGILGWVGFAFVGFNEDRGMVVSVIIGSVGGLFGGKLIAPMFTAAATIPDAFSLSAVFFAAAVAAAFLAVGDLVDKRWGV